MSSSILTTSDSITLTKCINKSRYNLYKVYSIHYFAQTDSRIVDQHYNISQVRVLSPCSAAHFYIHNLRAKAAETRNGASYLRHS